MKLTALLLLGAIILHQTILPAVNGILIIELGLLALFYFGAGPLIKEWRRKQEIRSYLKGVEKRYLSKSGKDWRDSKSSVEVQVNKETYFDKL